MLLQQAARPHLHAMPLGYTCLLLGGPTTLALPAPKPHKPITTPACVLNPETLNLNPPSVPPGLRPKPRPQAGLEEGFVNVLSRHTTTAVTINENESRLIDDVRQVHVAQRAPASQHWHCQL